LAGFFAGKLTIPKRLESHFFLSFRFGIYLSECTLAFLKTMSNFSSIGFSLQSKDEFEQLVDFCFENGEKIKCSDGSYFIYSDKSGAELYGQINNQNEIIGINPHFNGKSRRNVCLTRSYSEAESELDGAFYCWADPQNENNPESGVYPFVFDVPNFKTIGQISYPKNFEIQLSAFAQEIAFYDDEQTFLDKQNSGGVGENDLKFASQSFIPSGLLSEDENNTAQAIGFFAGIIKECKQLTNFETKGNFNWLLVETLGGEVDIISDPALTNNQPKVGGVAQGTFWLSGRLIDPPFRDTIIETKKPFWKKLFGLRESFKQ
jgi:hypothetical protein